MPPKQKVDLDLDALAPPNRTVRLHGKVYEVPGDIGVDTIIRAMQLQDLVGSADEEESKAAIEAMMEIIYDLFRACDPKFEPIPLTITQVAQIIGLVLSGMNVSMNDAVREAIVGDLEAEEEESGENPPTSRRARVRVVEGGRNSRSRKRSLAPS